MTYRERRERKADRLREWAAKREAKANATLESHEVYRGDHAFNFQPGHIPIRERVIKQADRAFESLDKAREMQSHADGIDAAAKRAIYSDDLDAREALMDRIDKLEQERRRIKRYNKSCKEGRRCLDFLTDEEQRDILSFETVPSLRGMGNADGSFPSYKLSNLSGNINRNKKRLAAMYAKEARESREANDG